MEGGAVFIRHGGRHDWYQNPATKVSQPVPRHREIKEHLARHILKMLSGKPWGRPLLEMPKLLRARFIL